MEFFTISDIGNKGFYPIPEKLFNNKHYQKKVMKIKKIKEKGFMVPKEITTTEELLSDTSKLMYGIMCRYLNFSLQNGWFDKEKRVYIKLSVSTLAEILNKSLDTVIKSKKQLESVGLLKIVKTQYKSDTFYLGKVKNIPEEDIVMEIENRIKEKNNLELESIEYSTPSEKLLDSIESGVLDNVEPIKVVSIKDNKRVVAEEKEPAAASEDEFIKNLKELLSGSSIKNLNPNTLKNIITFSNNDITVVERAIAFMKLKNKSMTPSILVAILRDGDFRQEGAVTQKEIKRNDKVKFMASRLGEVEVKRLRVEVLNSVGFECAGIDDQLGNILCRRFNEYIDNGGVYV